MCSWTEMAASASRLGSYAEASAMHKRLWVTCHIVSVVRQWPSELLSLATAVSDANFVSTVSTEELRHAMRRRDWDAPLYTFRRWSTNRLGASSSQARKP